MALTLVLGPANSGKVARLLDGFLEAIDGGLDPVLIVPNRPAIDAAEHDLLRRRPLLGGGWIGTFDDIFRELLRRLGESRPVLTDVQRRALLREVAASGAREGVGPSAGSAGFVDALAVLADEVGAASAPAGLPLDGAPAALLALVAEYRRRLDELGVT